MISIELKDVRIHASHGLYPGESLTGNNYEINLSVKFDDTAVAFTSIENTIDYAELYDIIRQRMQHTTALLEKLCSDIVQQIKATYPAVSEVTLTVYKIQAPIENFEGKVGVTLHRNFDAL